MTPALDTISDLSRGVVLPTRLFLELKSRKARMAKEARRCTSSHARDRLPRLAVVAYRYFLKFMKIRVIMIQIVMRVPMKVSTTLGTVVWGNSHRLSID